MNYSKHRQWVLYSRSHDAFVSEHSHNVLQETLASNSIHQRDSTIDSDQYIQFEMQRLLQMHQNDIDDCATEMDARAESVSPPNTMDSDHNSTTIDHIVESNELNEFINAGDNLISFMREHVFPPPTEPLHAMESTPQPPINSRNDSDTLEDDSALIVEDEWDHNTTSNQTVSNCRRNRCIISTWCTDRTHTKHRLHSNSGDIKQYLDTPSNWIASNDCNPPSATEAMSTLTSNHDPHRADEHTNNMEIDTEIDPNTALNTPSVNNTPVDYTGDTIVTLDNTVRIDNDTNDNNIHDHATLIQDYASFIQFQATSIRHLSNNNGYDTQRHDINKLDDGNMEDTLMTDCDTDKNNRHPTNKDQINAQPIHAVIDDNTHHIHTHIDHQSSSSPSGSRCLIARKSRVIGPIFEMDVDDHKEIELIDDTADDDDLVMHFDGTHATPMGVPYINRPWEHSNSNSNSNSNTKHDVSPQIQPSAIHLNTHEHSENTERADSNHAQHLNLDQQIAMYKSRYAVNGASSNTLEHRINTILVEKALHNTSLIHQLKTERGWVKQIDDLIGIHLNNTYDTNIDDPLLFIIEFMHNKRDKASAQLVHKGVYLQSCIALSDHVLNRIASPSFAHIRTDYLNTCDGLLRKFQDTIHTALAMLQHRSNLNKQIRSTRSRFHDRNSRLFNTKHDNKRGVNKRKNKRSHHPIRTISMKDTALLPAKERQKRLKQYYRNINHFQLTQVALKRAKASSKQILNAHVKPRKPFLNTKQSIHFNKDELLVLGSHPKFIPYPKAPPFEQYGHALKSFMNQMRYRHWQATKTSVDKQKSEEQIQLEQEAEIGKYLEDHYGFPPLPYLKRRSKGMQKQPNHVLEMALTQLESSTLGSDCWTVDHIDELSRRIWRGIKSLNRRIRNGEFVLVNGDKSNRFGVMDCEDYVGGTCTFLDQCNFRRVPEDTSIQNITTLKSFKDTHIGSLFWRKYLEPTTPLSRNYKAGKCYGLGKDHKPGYIKPIRGICSVIGTSIEYTCRWLAYWLKAVQFSSPNLLIDMNHFQHMILLWNADPNINWSSDHESVHIASWDVKCMYGSIDTEQGNKINTKMADEFYMNIRDVIWDRFGNDTFIPTKYAFKKALDIVMNHNLIAFDNDYWIQDNGGAMGPAHTPPWADIAMIPIIRRANELLDEITIRNGLKIYRDDLVIIWRGSVDLVDTITSVLNSIDPRIQFETERDDDLCFGSQTHYLNSTISITNHGLESEHYIKPMKCTNPLPPTSHHNVSVFNTLPDTLFGQIRSISDDAYLHDSLTRAALECLKEGYKRARILRVWRKYSSKSKMDLLYPSRNNYNLPAIRVQYNLGDRDPYALYEQQRLNQHNIRHFNHSKYDKRRIFFNTNNIQLIFTYHPNLPKIKPLFQQMFNTLKLDPTILGPNGWFKEDMVEVHYKRDANLKDLLLIGVVGEGYTRNNTSTDTNANSSDNNANVDSKEDTDENEEYIGTDIHQYMMHLNSGPCPSIGIDCSNGKEEMDDTSVEYVDIVSDSHRLSHPKGDSQRLNGCVNNNNDRIVDPQLDSCGDEDSDLEIRRHSNSESHMFDENKNEINNASDDNSADNNHNIALPTTVSHGGYLAPSETWSCSICTFAQSIHNTECEVCGDKKESITHPTRAHSRIHNLGTQMHVNTSIIHTSSTYHRDITATNPSHIRTIIESNDTTSNLFPKHDIRSSTSSGNRINTFNHNKIKTSIQLDIRNGKKKHIRAGCHLCTNPKCNVCTTHGMQDTKFMLVGDYFVTNDNRKHRIKQHLTCNSDWAIYMLICINCGMYSFGSTTTTVNKRFSSHKSCIINNTNARDYPMVKHFNTPTNKCYVKGNKTKYLRLMVVDGLDERDTNSTRKVADSRLNGLEIHKQGISLSFLSGNSRLDFDNPYDNRRNYSLSIIIGARS
eukprot:208997_1